MVYKCQTFADLLYACYSRLRFRFGTLNEKRAVYVMSTLSNQKSLRFQNGTAISAAFVQLGIRRFPNLIKVYAPTTVKENPIKGRQVSQKANR